MNTSSRNRTQFADFQLIQDEILKFAGMKASELMSYFKEHPADALYSIPHPAGGTVFIGKKGGQAFSRISVTYLESLSSSGLEFESHAFTDELKKLYLEWIVSGKTLDPTTLCQLLDDAAARRRSAHISLQHCIPCSVVFAEIPPEFEVGPVKFRRMLDFLSEHLSLIKNRAGAVRHSTGQAPQRERSKRSQADFLVQELEQFFPTFKWIASIVIPACDSSVSKERAHRAVQSSLDLLKLFLSGMRTSGIRQAHRSRHSPNIVELTRDERGQFHIGWRRGPEDAVVDNNWHAMITSYYNWTAATKILESSIASVETRKLYQRFLDALTWYGDGISEETYAGKLVKFVAALERITVTSGEKAGYNKVARRAAILASDRTEEGWLKYFRATQAVHSWRSNLMHGSGSPFDRSVPRHAANAEHISRRSLFRYLDLIRNLPADPRSDENWLATQYGRLEGAYPKS